MRQKLSPKVAAIVILAAIGAAVLSWAKFGRGSQGNPNTALSGMPLEVQAEFQKRLGAKSQAAGGATITGSNGPTAPIITPPSGAH